MSDCSTFGDFDRWFVVVSGLGRSPGGGKGYHSGILAWRIPWTVRSRARLSDLHIWCCHPLPSVFLIGLSSKSVSSH